MLLSSQGFSYGSSFLPRAEREFRMTNAATDNPYSTPSAPVSTEHQSRHRQQVATIGTMYAGYSTSMILRMIPTVAGSSIVADSALGIDLTSWGVIVASGTVGGMTGKFLFGWSADKFGGKKTFTVGLLIASLFVSLFAMSSSKLMFQISFFLTYMAQASGWPSMTKIIVNWIPPKKYGRVWGILSTSSRVGTLTATFVLGSLLAFMSWRGMLLIASAIGFAVTAFYALAMKERPAIPLMEIEPSSNPDSVATIAVTPAHRFDGLSLLQAIPMFLCSLRFWLICGSLMGLTILWDFLSFLPLYLKDTQGLSAASASMAASAFPLGSLISVLIGGFVFDSLDRRIMAWVMGGLLLTATGCIVAFSIMPQWTLSEQSATLISLGLLFVFGLCVSPCYYIPVSVFSIDFGGPHSGFLVAILDAVGFSASAVFTVYGGRLADSYGWGRFLAALIAVCIWSVLTTFFFMQREARNKRQREMANGAEVV